MAASLKSSYLFAQHAQIYKQLKNVIKILMQALLVILFTFPQFYGYKKVYHKMKIIHHYILFSSQRPAAKLHHKLICLAEYLESFPTHSCTQITRHTHHPHGADNLNTEHGQPLPSVAIRALNEPSRRFHNHGEVLYQGLLLVESTCQCFHIQDKIKKLC